MGDSDTGGDYGGATEIVLIEMTCSTYMKHCSWLNQEQANKFDYYLIQNLKEIPHLPSHK